MATSLEIRDTLNALTLDLIGPSPGHAREAEVLEHPSRWYFTGFLVPTLLVDGNESGNLAGC